MIALPVLLSRLLGRLTAGLTAQPSPAPLPSLALWANVLRVVDGGSERDLALNARISRRLAVTAVSTAAARGWVTTVSGERGRHVALTAAGRAATTTWADRVAENDLTWSGTPLRAALHDVVQQLPYELAHHPATYGTADPSAIGGPFIRTTPRDGLPAHGTDWRWVPRTEPVTAPITALLAQALTAYAIDYEATPMWPLASTTLVVQCLPDEPTPLAALVEDHGVTGQGTSLLERHGLAIVQDMRVSLTPYGKKIKDHHVPTLAAVEASWRDRYGSDAVIALRSALEADPAAADEALPDHVLAPLHHG